MSSIINHKKVSLQTKLSYGLGGFGKDFGLNVVNIFLFFYYTDVVGVSATFVGVVFLVARIWDTINDPIMGYIVSKTKSRWGKYKPWIFIGNILNAISLIALFSAHYFSGTSQLIYVAITYVAWGMTYTLLDAPFWSLIPIITMDKSEREKLIPYPRLFASLGNCVAGGFGISAVNFFGNGDQNLGFLILSFLAAIFAIVSATITCIWTERNFKENNEVADKFNFKDAFLLVFRNDQFLILLIFALLYNISNNMISGLNLYYYKYVLGNQDLFGTSMIWAGIFGTGILLILSKTITLFGRRLIFSASVILPAVSIIILSLAASFAPQNILLIALSGIASGLSMSFYWTIIYIMVADTIDYGDIKLDLRSESISYSVHTFISKCSGAFTGLMIGVTLAWINYVPNQEQTTETLLSLKLVYLAPIFLCLLSFFIFYKFYRLNNKVLDDLQLKIEAKHLKDFT